MLFFTGRAFVVIRRTLKLVLSDLKTPKKIAEKMFCHVCFRQKKPN